MADKSLDVTMTNLVEESAKDRSLEEPDPIFEAKTVEDMTSKETSCSDKSIEAATFWEQLERMCCAPSLKDVDATTFAFGKIQRQAFYRAI